MKRWLIVAIPLLLSTSAGGQEIMVTDPTGADPRFAPELNEYVVEKGDTLWDITARVVGNPFLWPKVWSFNPEITNPHWIYPGDIIRFYEPDIDLPTTVELIADNRLMPLEGAVEEISGDYPEDGNSHAGPDIEVIDTAPERKDKSRYVRRRLVNMFVTEQEMQEAGVLTNAAPDHFLLSTGDRIYITFPDGQEPPVGDRYLIYRTVDSVTHPTENTGWGYMTQITGFASVLNNEDGVTEAEIIFSALEIERGQLVTRMERDPFIHVVPVPDEELVFIDKGTNDGVERGNRFQVIESGDQLTGLGLPPRPIALLQVVDAKPTASTCLVLHTRRELATGDVIRSAKGKGAY